MFKFVKKSYVFFKYKKTRKREGKGREGNEAEEK
tara:strand:- start:578 stop:679 length:102 start_codon:yes stop_codon:yes gene_type:complete